MIILKEYLDPYEEQIMRAEKDALRVYEKPFKTYDGRIKGNKICIRRDMPQIKKACILAEERGHFHTCTSNLLESSEISNDKLEIKGRRWAHNEMIGLRGLTSAYNRHCETLEEMADYLNVTEEFLLEALDAYREIYGTGIHFDSYYISFEPYFVVYKIMD